MTSTSPDSVDRERMLAFALRWLPYGGGQAEDIMVTFGIAAETYFLRLRTMLADADLHAELDQRTVGALSDVCRRRLHPMAISRDQVPAVQ
ncbi:hypothetical protein [Rhodococcus sp. IEGM 1330]|uniref:hypothetical protein n=1 Tax=Rhodococcus sp. IEGM 1330 TaxID=3082225 RepID=UPI00295499C8|nr:hypothetical protein [Rhodococcus sp. IEGM 1330]MDV8022198.1 hypothetical protein [Rhodococcus sp. IEGM 1330]